MRSASDAADRQDEAEPIKTFRQLPHLRRRMLASFPAQRLQGRNRHKFGIKIAGDGKAVGARPLGYRSRHDEKENTIRCSLDLTPERRPSGLARERDKRASPLGDLKNRRWPL